MENTRTPPPWKARLSPNGHSHHITGPDNIEICKVYSCPYDQTEPPPPYGTMGEAEGTANARAIVQAINTREVMLRALLAALGHLLPAPPPGLLPTRTSAEVADIVAAAIRAATEEL